ncbi:hypothetical protein [Spirulina sp. 06S082]|uniref:hypothetical protein n=1 Tax=Spirulina sp. 06S082 TaxID=3110248 RepID=UPI002B1F6983|nr:hypothetical protein [Spirulina sp. 06S082]MEA5468434.1 hypothetical protein [Spirulina sp. 06S082]
MFHINRYHFLIPLIATLTTVPVLAQNANFNPLNLARGFDRADATVTGNTGGHYDLANNLSSRDYQGNICMGFGSQIPDHIMELTEDITELTLSIHSGGKDTTLVIQGPDSAKQFRCGDNGASGEDAAIHDTDWKAGVYKIWVGSMNSENWHYRLSARE